MNIKKLAADIAALTLNETQTLVQLLSEQSIDLRVTLAPCNKKPLVVTENTYSVFLEEVPADAKLGTCKAIKTVLEIGLKEAKDLMDSAPCMLKEGLSLTEAEEIKRKLMHEINSLSRLWLTYPIIKIV